ncbi:MAG TPA: diapophytoene dehydrogenase [Flavobacteriales bacterium]|nr:diapophytoene dehydrogenase [Flavobacteriales bacterium]|tara:strand:+ start:117896 stop:119242 length:1347 start_codon:yes stop_codon:yes gene_type:complete
MAEIEILLPKMGESVAEATIIKWLKSEGDSVEADEPIVEIATDKVDSEVPAPEDGILVKVLVNEDDVVQVGDPIAIYNIGGEETVVKAPAAKSETTAAPAPEVIEAVSAPLVATESGPIKSNDNRFYSPLVKNIAKTEGISQTELDGINGTGKESRVTKTDILDYIENKGSATPVAAPLNQNTNPAPKATENKPEKTKSTAAQPKPPVISIGSGDEIVEMDRMRKLIADHMVMSVRVSPHVTSYVEVDMTNVVTWRNKVKNKFMEKEGEKITFTPIIIEAIAKAIKDMPGVNVSVDGTKIIKRKHINIGMAAALPTGNLIVPVIKDADMLNLGGMAKKVNDLANRSRTNTLKPEDIQGGTYTFTNVGTFGNVMGTPIINQPQVAIMAAGAIRKKPAVIETEHGDLIGIRHMMFLSHSYDHRVVDGMLGGTFVKRVAEYLENFDTNREL